MQQNDSFADGLRFSRSAVLLAEDGGATAADEASKASEMLVGSMATARNPALEFICHAAEADADAAAAVVAIGETVILMTPPFYLH